MATIYSNVELEAAKIASLSPVMDQVATEAATMARTLAPRRTNLFASSIGQTVVYTKRGVKDRLVYSTDPEANIIELGHLTPSGNWVAGHFVFKRVLAAFK